LAEILIVFGLVVILAVGGYLLLRLRPLKKEAYFYFRCPYCDRKVRFRERLAGSWTICPACKHHFTVPAVPPK
jgi:hypothetical protein